jgi:hypothetical protein
MRRSTALMLTAPSFAEIICASTLVYPNILGAFLAPLIFFAFPLLIVGIAMASRRHEETSRGTWTLLVFAGVSQLVTLISLGAFRG